MTESAETEPREVLGAPSWRVATPEIEAFVTEVGGHMGPVTFDRASRPFAPYAVAPWHGERLSDDLPPLLRNLRGDFFCLPFGGNDRPHRGRRFPPHGETANGRWRRVDGRTAARAAGLHLRLELGVTGGAVEKRIGLQAGEPAVYLQHAVRGVGGRFSLGHHAMLAFPDREASGRVTTSRFLRGQVYPGAFEEPADGGYSALKPGALFRNLRRVPYRDGGRADLTRFPVRRGFEELVQVLHQPADELAWTACVWPRQRRLWLALKDPAVLRSTVLWLSQGGRHYPPWNGRHRGVLGVEDTTSYFHEGQAASVGRNGHTDAGFVTALALKRDRPLAINHIQACVRVPRGFDEVRRVRPSANGVEVESASGAQVFVPLELDFLSAEAGQVPGLE